MSRAHQVKANARGAFKLVKRRKVLNGGACEERPQNFTLQVAVTASALPRLRDRQTQGVKSGSLAGQGIRAEEKVDPPLPEVGVAAQLRVELQVLNVLLHPLANPSLRREARGTDAQTE